MCLWFLTLKNFAIAAIVANVSEQLNMSLRAVPKSRRRSFVRRSSMDASTLSLGETQLDELNTIFYRDVLGVCVRRDNKKGHREGGGVCHGLNVVTYAQKEGNRLKVRGP